MINNSKNELEQCRIENTFQTLNSDNVSIAEEAKKAKVPKSTIYWILQKCVNDENSKVYETKSV